MNDIHKRTLRHHQEDLLKDLELSSELRAKFIQYGLLNEEMVDEIMHERTRKDKVLKFLQILPRRGPMAFDKFVRMIKDNYPWLSEALRNKYHELTSRTEAEMVDLKTKVAIYVHEEFGNSKRFCEQDKKRIEKFLYKQLKNRPVTDIYGNEVQQRRASIDSTNSDQSVLSSLQESVTDAKDVEVQLLTRIYSALGGANKELPSAQFLDDVDGKPEMTIEMIESRVKEMSETCDRLKNEMNDCFTALGIEAGCDRPLHQIIEKLVQVHENDAEEIDNLNEKCETLYEQMKDLNALRDSLESDLHEKEVELRNMALQLADSQEENNMFETQLRDLKTKCTKLEKVHMKYTEKQQTLMTLKHLVKEMQTSSSHIHDSGHHERGHKTDGVRLPKIHHGKHEPHIKGHQRKGLLGHHSDNHEDPRLTHHPPVRHSTNTHASVLPWK